MRRIGLLCTLVLATSSCSTPGEGGEPDASAALDPTGNWNVTYTFAPSCGNAGNSSTGTFTVTLDSSGYAIQVVGVASTGTLLCSGETCKLSGTFAWTASGVGFQQSMNLVLDAANKVTGTGTETVVAPDSTCTYPFTVTGSKT